MKRIIGEYPIFDGETNTECIATLCSPICPEHIDDFENLWLPAMKERVAQATSISEVNAANLQDEHWHWWEKQIDREHRLDWDSFVVECEGVAQGMMFVETFGFARAAGQERLPLIYIDLVSVAPWNRVGFTATPKYKGIGRLLIGVGLSLEARSQELSIKVIQNLSKQYGNTLQSTLWRTVEDRNPDEAVFGMVSIVPKHPHIGAEEFGEQPRLIRSQRFREQFYNVSAEQVFGLLDKHSNYRKRGPIVDGADILTDVNGDDFEFKLEGFSNTYSLLSFGVCSDARTTIIQV